jgi:hypothetical protein
VDAERNRWRFMHSDLSRKSARQRLIQMSPGR